MNKDDFIKIVSSSTPEELSKIIQEKGKPMKPMTPFIFLNDK